MNRLVLVIVTLTSGLVFALSSPASAADLGTVTVAGNDPAITLSATSLNAQVGDTFTINNTSDRDISIQGPISRTSDGRNCATSGDPWCVRTKGAQHSFTVNSLGTVTIKVYNGGAVGAQIGTVTLGSGSSSSSSGVTELLKGTFDANGGTCFLAAGVRESVTNDIPSNGRMSNWAYHSVSPLYMPGVAECTRTGYRFAG